MALSKPSLSLGQTGTVDNVKTVFEWEIDNIRLVSINVGGALTSPEFLVNNKKWLLKLYPNGRSQECEGYVSTALQSMSQASSIELILVISLVNYSNKLLFSWMECVNFSAKHTSWEIEKFMKYNELLSELGHVLPDNKLKVKCEFLPKTSNLSNVYTPMNFESFFNSEMHSDVKFSIKGKVLYAHKIILSNKSAFYAAMFQSNMKESVENVVDVTDIEYEVFFEMLRYVYTGRVKNMKNNVKDLLIAADKYAIDDLKFICGECLCNSLYIDNVVEYLGLADLYNVKSLKTRTIDFILTNVETLINTPSFQSIVELRGELVFEVIRCLVQNKSKTNSKTNETTASNLQNMFTMLPISYNFAGSPGSLESPNTFNTPQSFTSFSSISRF